MRFPYFFLQSRFLHNLLALEKSSIYELFKKSSVGVVRVTPSLPQRGRLPKGSSSKPPSCAKFSINLLAQRGSDGEPLRRINELILKNIRGTCMVHRLW